MNCKDYKNIAEFRNHIKITVNVTALALAVAAQPS